MCCHKIACVRWRCCDNVAMGSGPEPKPVKGSEGIVLLKALADSSEALQRGLAVYKYIHPGMQGAFMQQVLTTQTLKTAYEELQKQTSEHEVVRRNLEAYNLAKSKSMQRQPKEMTLKEAPRDKKRDKRSKSRDKKRQYRSPSPPSTRAPNPSASSRNPHRRSVSPTMYQRFEALLRERVETPRETQSPSP